METKNALIWKKIKIKKCKGCKFIFPIINPKKKFCSAGCKARFNALNLYNIQKNNLDFKIKRKEIMKKWYIKHQEEHKLKMKEYMRERKQRMMWSVK